MYASPSVIIASMLNIISRTYFELINCTIHMTYHTAVPWAHDCMVYSLKQEAIWPTYLEGWILLFSRSSLLLFILIFHSLAAIWLNSTRISVILIYNAGFYILLAMINSCRVFSISFLCMPQKMGVFQSIWSSFAKFQFEAHLHGFCISEVHFQGFYLRCTLAN